MNLPTSAPPRLCVILFLTLAGCSSPFALHLPSEWEPGDTARPSAVLFRFCATPATGTNPNACR